MLPMPVHSPSVSVFRVCLGRTWKAYESIKTERPPFKEIGLTAAHQSSFPHQCLTCCRVTASGGNTWSPSVRYFDKQCFSVTFGLVWLTLYISKFNHLFLLLWLSYCRSSKPKLPIFSWFKPSWYNADSHYAALTHILYKLLLSSSGQEKGFDFLVNLASTWCWDAFQNSLSLSVSLTLSLLLSLPHLLAPHRCALAVLYICSNNNTVSIIKPRMS